tara:strand:- start:214 stop:864 length:651 start_codon:yes stop_codon:yes gene_type:complete
MSLPDKKYSILYMDPPWQYRDSMQNRGTITSSAAQHYNTMSLAELKALDIRSISEKNCILFMWATGPQLDVAIELGISYGFKYKTLGFCWNKERKNPGAYTVSQCEFVLVFTRGSIPSPRGTRNERQYFCEKRTGRHSEKPHSVRAAIDRMFPQPEHARLELFARHNIPGWECWGNDPSLINNIENNITESVISSHIPDTYHNTETNTAHVGQLSF